MIFSLHRFHCISTYFFHQMCHISTIVLKCSHSSHIFPWPFSPRDFLPKKSSSLPCLLVYFQPLAPTLTYYFTLGLLYCNLPSLEKLVISGSWRSIKCRSRYENPIMCTSHFITRDERCVFTGQDVIIFNCFIKYNPT